MTPRQRLWLFAIGAAGLVACYLWAFAGLPGFGNYPGPYGPTILKHVIAQTNATGVVSAVNFAYRGFDTVGEEFILFTAAAGMSVVLRRLRGEREGRSSPAETAATRQLPATSSAVRIVTLLLVGPTAVIGWWLATHAQANPSGGFQGGVILATAFFLVYLSGEFIVFRRLSPDVLLDAAEALGAGGFAAVGVTAVAMSLPYLYNYLPLGTIPGAVSSSGTIALISFLVGIEVAAAFVLIIGELLEQTLLSGWRAARGEQLMQVFPFLVVAWIVVVGLYGMITSRDLIHQIVCLIVVQSSTYVLLLGVGYVTGGVAPYFFDISPHAKAVDPVVQALALTDVVVEAAVTALLLSFAIQAHKRFGTLDPHELAEFKG